MGLLNKSDSGQVNNFKQQQLGIAAIDMPGFYMAHTDTAWPSTTSPLHTTAQLAGEMNIPGGVINLRFGGVDATYTPPGRTPLNQTGKEHQFAINLGLPLVVGTSVIVNSVTSDAQVNPTSGSPPFQDIATFLLTGRLNLFQANSINGNTTSGLVPTHLVHLAVAGTNLAGGHLPDLPGRCGHRPDRQRPRRRQRHQLHHARRNPSPTPPAEGQLDAKISNFSIGGETNNVLLVAPTG